MIVNPSRRRPWLLAILSVILLLPYLVNVLGWNLYLFTNIGNTDVIFATAQGVGHIAIADHYEEPDAEFLSYMPDYLKQFQRDLLRLGPFWLFAERSDGVPHTFRVALTNDDGYKAIDFPWLILPLVLGAAAVWCGRQAGADHRPELTGDARGGE